MSIHENGASQTGDRQMAYATHSLADIIVKASKATGITFHVTGTGRAMRMTDTDGGTYAAKGEREVIKYMQGMIFCAAVLAKQSA
jgi:ribose 5-phosphate isomerase RpiB